MVGEPARGKGEGAERDEAAQRERQQLRVGRCHSRASATTTTGKTSIARWSSRCPRLRKGTRKCGRRFRGAPSSFDCRSDRSWHSFPRKSTPLSAFQAQFRAWCSPAARAAAWAASTRDCSRCAASRWSIGARAPHAAGDEIIINANQNLAPTRAFGHRVVSDQIGGFAGPLAGLHAGLKAAAHPLVVTVPCDSPFLPSDLVSRLNRTGRQRSCGGEDRRPGAPGVRAREPRRCARTWRRFSLAAGARSTPGTPRSGGGSPFDDEADAFRNINTLDELKGA